MKRNSCENIDFLKNIGINFSFGSRRIKAKLYKKPEDFVVEEIQENNEVVAPNKRNTKIIFGPGKKYVHAVLVKKGISTFEACNIIALKNGLNYFKDVSACGLKDTDGLTAQRICIRSKKKLKSAIFPKFFLKDFLPSNRKLKVGDHKGNRFVIKTEINKQERKIADEFLKNFSVFVKRGLPNFYGPQRFGVRQNNHRLAKLLVEKRYDDFIFKFLTETNNEIKEVKDIRAKIKDNYGNWRACQSILKCFRDLPDEKELISNLLRKDKITSIKNMKLSSFYVYSYISYLFNCALSSCLKNEYKNIAIQKIGLQPKLNKLNQKLYNPILKKENIHFEEVKAACENFSVRGKTRNALFFPKNFNFRIENNVIILEFDLGKGQYASLVMDFLFDNQAKIKQKLN